MNHFKVKADHELLIADYFQDGTDRELVCRVSEVVPMENGDCNITLEVYDVYEI